MHCVYIMCTIIPGMLATNVPISGRPWVRSASRLTTMIAPNGQATHSKRLRSSLILTVLRLLLHGLVRFRIFLPGSPARALFSSHSSLLKSLCGVVPRFCPKMFCTLCFCLVDVLNRVLFKVRPSRSCSCEFCHVVIWILRGGSSALKALLSVCLSSNCDRVCCWTPLRLDVRDLAMQLEVRHCASHHTRRCRRVDASAGSFNEQRESVALRCRSSVLIVTWIPPLLQKPGRNSSGARASDGTGAFRHRGD